MEGWIEDLYRRHSRAISSYLCTMTADRHAAEDLTQETFARAIAAADRFRAFAAPRTWLFTIARNLAINHMRAHSRASHLRLEDVAEPEGRFPGPFEAVGADDDASAVRAAVKRLKPELREVFLLKVVEGLKYREIADILGCPTGTVQSRFHRALTQTRQALSAQGARDVLQQI